MKQSIERVSVAIEAVRQGKMVVLVDDEDRENEGDLAMAAELVTPEAINFMAMHARGLICLTLTESRVEQLQLPMMVDNNTSSLGTAFTVSIEAKQGVTTGISAHDRATTVLAAIRDDARPEDLVRPGHIFPLRAKKGGVLVRTGQTEGSVDLARMAGLKPAGVICEIMKDDGTMARMPDLEVFSRQHGIPIVTVADLVDYRLQQESLVSAVRETTTRNEFGEWRLRLYQNSVDSFVHVVMTMGDVSGDEPVLVRVHSGCLAGEVLGVESCSCGKHLRRSMEIIAKEGRGVLLYLQQEAMGTNLLKLFDSHVTREKPDARAGERGPSKPILREFGIGAQIIHDLGVRRMRLLTDHDRLLVALQGYGLEVTELVPLSAGRSPAQVLPLKPVGAK